MKIPYASNAFGVASLVFVISAIPIILKPSVVVSVSVALEDTAVSTQSPHNFNAYGSHNVCLHHRSLRSCPRQTRPFTRREYTHLTVSSIFTLPPSIALQTLLTAFTSAYPSATSSRSHDPWTLTHSVYRPSTYPTLTPPPSAESNLVQLLTLSMQPSRQFLHTTATGATMMTAADGTGRALVERRLSGLWTPVSGSEVMVTEGGVWNVGLFEVWTGVVEGAQGGARGIVMGVVLAGGMAQKVVNGMNGQDEERDRRLVKEFMARLEREPAIEGQRIQCWESVERPEDDAWKNEVEAWCKVLKSPQFLDIKTRR